MRRSAVLLLSLLALPLAAQDATPRPLDFRGKFADYDSELRTTDGRVDVDALTARLADLGVTTYYWLIWHAPTDWDDLQRFLPKAREAGIEVWVYLVPPSESPPHTTLYSEPFRLDYGRWAEEIARLSLSHPNLTAWVIDDFLENHAFFTPAVIQDLQARARRIQPKLAFLPLLYYGEISRAFVESYREVIDGVVAAYPQSRAEIDAAWGFLNDAVQVGFGENVRAGRRAFHVPFFVMTAGDAGEFRLRHGEPTTPERIAEWLRMSLDAWREGKCDGVVTYCLDKTPASVTFAPARALFREYGSPRKLIEFGWDEPDTAFLRKHIAAMQATPFDGCVFHVLYGKPDGGTGNFTWEGWSTRVFTEAELSASRADLMATDFGRFRENFLRFNTTPADIDWFDDFGAVLANARLAAKIARDGKCPGLLFDIEQYNAPLFDYSKQRDAKTRTWDDYAARVRQRGREVMAAFQEGFPDLVVFLTFGYSLPWVQSERGKHPLSACSYGLLAPFVDGLVEAARGRTRIVDGYELAYGYEDPALFPKARAIMRTELLSLVKDTAAYARTLSVSFGLWLDHDWRNRPWDVEDFSKNLYTPPELEAAVRAALRNADDYVWIYSETPRWWTDEGPPLKIPEAYAEALRKARER